MIIYNNSKIFTNIIKTYTNTFYIASFNINFIKNIDLNVIVN